MRLRKFYPQGEAEEQDVNEATQSKPTNQETKPEPEKVEAEKIEVERPERVEDKLMKAVNTNGSSPNIFISKCKQ